MKYYLHLIFCFCIVKSLYSQDVNFSHWNLENGLPSNETYQVLQDGAGYIWICTDHGVVRYDGQAFELYSTITGLAENTVFRMYLDYKNRVWFLGMLGTLCYWDGNQMVQHPANRTIEKILNYQAVVGNIAVDSNEVLYFVKSAGGDGYYSVGVEDSMVYFTSLKEANVGDTGLLVLNETINLLITNIQSHRNTWNGKTKEHVLPMVKIPKTIRNVKREYTAFNPKQIFLKKDTFFVYDMLQDSLLDFRSIGVSNYVYSASFDRKEQLWIPTKDGILFFGKAPFWTNPKRFFKGIRIASIYEDREGNYWIATLNQGVFMVGHWEVLHFFKEEQMSVSKIVALKEQIVGVGEHYFYQLNHQYPFDEKTKMIHEEIDLFDIKIFKDKLLLSGGFMADLGDAQLLFNKHFYSNVKYYGKSIYIDTTEEKIMVGYAKGLWEIDKNFHRESLCQEYWINAIEKKTKDEWWLGTTEGLYYYHKGRNEMVNLGNQNRLLLQSIFAISYFQDYLLVGTKGNGIIVLNPTNFQVLQQWTTLDGLSSVFVHCLTIENDSTLWVGTNQGANRLTVVNGKIKFSKTFDVHNYLPSNGVNDILVQDSMFWFATDKGMAQISHKVLYPRSSGVEIPIYTKEIKINGNSVDLKNHYSLAYNEHNILVNFLALSFNGTPSINYRYQLTTTDKLSKDWIYTNFPQANFNNLAPDSYQLRIEVKTKDGEWQKKGLKLSFEIHPHFTQTWIFLLFISVVTIVIISVYVRYLIAQKNLAKELAEAEQKSLRSQLKPHFLFNAINSVVYFLYKNRNKKALKFLQKFSALMRSTLENSQHSLIFLGEDIEHLQLYLDMEYERLSSGSPYVHTFEISCSDNLNIEQWRIPPMLLQPLVENAIIHGLAPKEGDRKLLILLKEIDGNLVIIIEDNGIGRTMANEIKKQFFVKRTPQGLKMLKQRIKIIDKLLDAQIKLSVEDVFNDSDCSTRFTVVIPSMLKNRYHA